MKKILLLNLLFLSSCTIWRKTDYRVLKNKTFASEIYIAPINKKTNLKLIYWKGKCSLDSIVYYQIKNDSIKLFDQWKKEVLFTPVIVEKKNFYFFIDSLEISFIKCVKIQINLYSKKNDEYFDDDKLINY